MEGLVQNYEREVAILRKSVAEFATRFPKIAARLAISGEQIEDIHVERMLQSAALLNAGVQTRLTDSYPEFATSFLETVYPEFLRPFPSCTIVAIEPLAASNRISQPVVIERGTGLTTKVGDLRFDTIYDIVVGPLRVEQVAYRLPAGIPSSVQVPEATSGVLSISFGAIRQWIEGKQQGQVRLFIDAQPATAASVIDSILLRSRNAFVEADNSGRWKRLQAVPVSAAGFDPRDELIARPGSQSSPYRYLLEYFAFPEKFNFVDVDLGLLAQASGANEKLTLHVPIAGVHPDSATAQALLGVSAHNFRLSCTPVINLFSDRAEPIALKDAPEPVFNLVPQEALSAGLSIWSVDAVRLVIPDDNAHVEDIAPFNSLAHHQSNPGKQSRFWTCDGLVACGNRYAKEGVNLGFLDMDAEVVRPEGATQIDVDLRCFNGMEPCSWQWGALSGDFLFTDKSRVGKVTALRQPTPSSRSDVSGKRLWNAINMLSSGPFSLDKAGLPAFKELLSGHLPGEGSKKGKLLIDAIIGLSREAATEWVVEKPQSRLVRGLRVRLVVNEQLIVGHAVASFARVLESLFERYASQNSFVQLVIVSGTTGAELRRGPALAGAIPLI